MTPRPTGRKCYYCDVAETWPDGLNKLPVIVHTKECPRNADSGPEPKFTAEWMRG